MDHTSISVYLVIDTFLLLLIGIGPKIALVPFLELTATIDLDAKTLVVRKMLITAAAVAADSRPARRAACATAALLNRIAFHRWRDHPDHHRRTWCWSADQSHGMMTQGRDPAEVAVFPLAIPYLLNPAGIVTLVTLSAEADSLAVFGMVLGLLVVVLALDVAVFRWANRVSDHLDESRILATEKVFGVLLAALAVQLMLDGLDSVGIIHLTGH